MLIPFSVEAVDCRWNLYDSFRNTSLNTYLWNETLDWESWPMLSYHSVEPTRGVYSTSQFNTSNSGVLLTLNTTFRPGERVQYGFSYNSGEGNRLSRIFINGIPLDIRMRDIDHYNCNNYATCGNIGYWNGESEWGNTLGWYFMKVVFGNDTAEIILKRPDGSIKAYATRHLIPPYTFGVSTRTGHNGIARYDYYPFQVCKLME